MTDDFKINTKINRSLRIKERTITGRYMSLASAPRESSVQNERPSMAVQAAPAPAGDSLLVSRFLPTQE